MDECLRHVKGEWPQLPQELAWIRCLSLIFRICAI